MKIKFLIDNKATDGSTDIPKLGIVESYIQEAVNQITLIELFVVSNSELDEKSCENLIGKNAVLSIGGEIEKEYVWSRFDGVIFELTMLDKYVVEKDLFAYRFIIRPPVWKMNFQTQYRSFADKSRIDVIDTILKDHQLEKTVNFDADYFASSKHYPNLLQVVQNETTDLMFMEQLFQEGGINYYFSATKNGDNPEVMKLADHNAFFKKVWTKDITWHPTSGQVAKNSVTSLTTRLCTTPSKVQATADTGDGLVRTFSGTGEIADGKGGKHVIFGRAGQDENVAKHKADVLTEEYTANKVTYEGRSNHIAIRSGEKITLKSGSNNQTKDLLVTSVQHTLKQSVPAAMNNEGDPEYENIFSALRKDAPIRPSQPTSSYLLNSLDKSPGNFVDKLIKRLSEELGVDLPFDIGDLPFLNLPKTIMSMLDVLARTLSSQGVFIGEVIESAKVTSGGELVCRIANEQFPETDTGGGLTAKVALGWLTKNGWLSLLPRKGNYVYFVFMNGEGGHNEAVVIGYRSTGVVKTLDPDKTQTTPKLAVGEAPKLGEKADKVVEKAEYKPSNRYRNTLQSEEGVSEVAVIDGGDDSVAIHANKGVHMVADSEIHIDAPVQCQNADELHQQFTTVNRGVAENQKESIGKHHEMTVMGSQNVFIGGTQKIHVEKEIAIDNNGEDDIIIANGKDNTFVLHKGEQAQLKTDDNDYLTIKNSGVIDLQSSDSVNIGAGKHTAVLNQDGIKLTVGGNVITISKSGSIEITGSGGITIDGGTVDIKGSSMVTVDGGPNVTVTGGVINLN
jgi:choline dehydrogenase-like flavoprotein